MATAKPKRMMFGGMAKGPMPNVQKPKSGLTAIGPRQNAASMAADAAKHRAGPRGALGGNKPPAGANLMQTYNAFNAQKSGNMGKGPQSAMKKGGAVKKKATKK